MVMMDAYAEAPGWLNERAMSKPKPKQVDRIPGSTTRYGERALSDELVHLSQVPKGGRNEGVNKSAFSMGQLIAGGELDQGQGQAALYGVAQSIGLTDKESRATIKSGIEAGMKEPRSAPQKTYTASNIIIEPCQQPIAEEPTIDPLAFPDIMAGAAGNFAKVLSSSLEPPIHFFYMAFLACLGNLTAGKLALNSEIQAAVRLYLLILGESADDRKSTAISKTVSFFRSTVTDFPVCHGVGSAEGLQKILVEIKNLLLVFDEFRAFTSKCKIESSVLMPAVTTLFESNHYESHTSKKSIKIEGAELSLLAASTVDTYEQIFDEHFLAIGFPNRIFLCPGHGKRRFSLPVRIQENEWLHLRQELGEVLDFIGDARTIEITLEARRIYHDWYMNLPQSVHAKRLETYAMRFMPLLAANELKEAVDEEIIMKVIDLMDWQYRIRCRYDPIDADNTMARTEEKIRRALKTGPKTRRDLSRAVHAHRIGTWFFETALNNLTKGCQIQSEDKGRTFRLFESESVTTSVTTISRHKKKA